MHRLQEVVRLHRIGKSRRAIARQMRMGRDTIRLYLEAIEKAGRLEGNPGELPAVGDLRAIVSEHVAGSKKAEPASSVDRWRPQIEQLLDRGATPTPIHDWLRLHEPDFTGSLSAVKRLCLRINRERGVKPEDVAIPVQTDPGEVAQVDFGYAGKRYDPERGVMRKSWVFVMTLGFSRRMFCRLVFDQKVETWNELHVLAFEYFGAVPRVIVPDNLKAAVVRCAFGVDDDPVINRSYRELATHYGFQIDPTPPRSPEKKGKVERSVRYVKGNFLSTWESVDIDVDNRALERWNREIADRRRHGTTGRPPIELFEEVERAAMLPLPAKRWEPVVWKVAKLHRDSHIQVDGGFYSAPWRLLGQELWVRCTRHRIAIWHRDELEWTHPRVARGQRSTIKEHLPEGRRDPRHRGKAYWLDRAGKIGAEVEQLAAAIFDSDDVLLQLRRVMGVVTHLEKYPRRRAVAAARRALHFENLEVRSIKSILRKGLDLVALPEKKTRAWSSGSRFARKPYQTLFPLPETTDDDPR